MNYSQLKKILLSVLFCFVSLAASTQNTNSVDKESNMWQINYNLGFTQFYGDASNTGYFNKLSGQIDFATGATARIYFNPVFALGANFLYGNLKSIKNSQASVSSANYTFTGKYFDANLQAYIDFTNLFWGVNDRKLSVYGFIGIGYATWKSQLDNNISGTTTSSGDPIGTDTYKNVGFSMPAGLGINYMLGDSWAVNFDISLRTVFDDDVDVWRDGFKYDQPLYTGFGISYFINRNIEKADKRKRTTDAPVQRSSYQKSNKKRKTETGPAIIEQAPVDPAARVSFYDYNYSQVKKSADDNTVSTKTESTTPYKSQISSGIYYRVQILAVSRKVSNLKSLKTKYNISGDIYEDYSGGIYRYSTGIFSTYNEALIYARSLKNRGISDAFVVAYENGHKISITSEMKK